MNYIIKRTGSRPNAYGLPEYIRTYVVVPLYAIGLGSKVTESALSKVLLLEKKEIL